MLSELHENSLQQTARSMERNLMFYNIPAANDHKSTKATLVDFFKTKLKINETDLKQISIENAHRVGNTSSRGTRPIVAKFLSVSDKQKVLSHARNLKGTKFSISSQLPPELNERKKSLLPQYKEAKRQNKKVKWINDKLMIDNDIITARKDCNTQPQLFDEPLPSRKPVHTHCDLFGGSKFQGHMAEITSADQVIPTLHSLFTDIEVAQATHNIYAYRTATPEGTVEHFSDDGEWGAGRRLLKVLQERDMTKCTEGSTVLRTQQDGLAWIG